MSDNQPTVIQLFRKWRSGDESAGQEMAQKFSDWYYAISTIRVPGQEGRPPMEAACQSFAQGIITVTRPRALVDWAQCMRCRMWIILRANERIPDEKEVWWCRKCLEKLPKASQA